MKAWTLRAKLTLWSALVTGLALLTFGVAAAISLYFEQVDVIDDRLATGAGDFLATLAKGNRPDLAAFVRRSGKPLVGGCCNDGADRVVFSESKAVAELLAGRLPRRKLSTVLADRRLLRLGSFADGNRRVVLAADLGPALDSVLELFGAYLLALPVVLLVVAGGSWWLARRALRPIVQITEAAASITADRLGERLPVPPTADEIGGHIRVLNGMFDRLQRSFEQANRFSADAAHELRTPLTIMRGQIEDALRSDRLGPEQERLLVGLLEETTGLQKIADNLLLLARFDTGKSALQLAPVDLSALVAEAGEDAELLAAPRGIRVSAEIAPGLRVVGDAVMLRRVLLNLIDNAVKFNREAGEIRLELCAVSSDAILTVANTGPGLPPDRHASLFERFYRPGSGRDREAGGSGLGLSLCREIVLAHYGRIALSRADAEWTEFTVHLPMIAG